MDAATNTTEAASAAIPFDWEAAFESLEDLISIASERVKVVDYVVAKMSGRKSENGFRRIPDHEFDILLFLASDASASVRQIDNLWMQHNNDSISVEREIELARRAS